MMIAWAYLDKKSAAVDALKDYASMKYIIQNHHCELEEAMERERFHIERSSAYNKKNRALARLALLLYGK